MTSTIKVDNIQDQDGNNIINENANTITIGASGDTVTLASGASQSGFGRSGTVDWDTTAKTASFTAVSGNGYFVNTTSGAITVTLPASPSAGDIVAIADYTNTFATNNVTVARNSEPIGGVAADATLSTDGLSVTFVYVDGTEGWKNINDATSNITGNPNLVATGGTVTTCGDFKIHTFTGPGTFTVCKVSCTAAHNTVSYLVVAGGGGSAGVCGGANAVGGGGAGGFRENKGPSDCYSSSPLEGSTDITVTAQAYPITVGGGGAGGPKSSPQRGNSGSNSVFSTITSAGGGAGGHDSQKLGDNGGSGGGTGGGANNSGCRSSGNTPPVSPPQGSNGGSSPGGPPDTGAGGGGGATANGQDAAGVGGNGGAGANTSIAGSPNGYSGGGGGGAGNPQNTAGSGGPGGGGNGGTQGTGGQTGNPNTGGGAGGGGLALDCTGSAGGSGIVIIRYKFQ